MSNIVKLGVGIPFSENRDQAVRNGAAANLELGLPPLRVRLPATAMLPWLMLGPLPSSLETKTVHPNEVPKNGIFIHLDDNFSETSPEKVEKEAKLGSKSLFSRCMIILIFSSSEFGNFFVNFHTFQDYFGMNLAQKYP